MCAILVSEPHNVPRSELRNMTVTQFWRVYQHPRNKETGQLERPHRGEPEDWRIHSPKHRFLDYWEARRYPLWLIKWKWEQQEQARIERENKEAGNAGI